MLETLIVAIVPVSSPEIVEHTYEIGFSSEFLKEFRAVEYVAEHFVIVVLAEP